MGISETMFENVRKCREVIVLEKFPENTRIEIDIKNTIKNSLLNIWCDIGISARYNLYVIFKCFVMEFELLYANLMGEQHNQLCYTGKKVVICNKPNEINPELFMKQ